MEYVRLGQTGLKVSRICLGMMSYGTPEWRDWVLDEAAARPFVQRAIELGINFFDTADVYGWKKGEGVTEQIIGRWFAQGGGRREKTVIATKLYGDMGDWPNTNRLSKLHIRRACEGSLKRLQTDTIDLYQMHHIWREAPWEEIWEAMEILVRDEVDRRAPFAPQCFGDARAEGRQRERAVPCVHRPPQQRGFVHVFKARKAAPPTGVGR